MEDVARKWLPASWMDETIPRLEPSPDAYIFRFGDGFRLRCPPDSPDHGWDGCYDDALEDGQVVDFMWSVDCGWHTVTVADDGSWFCATGWRGDANCFCLDGDVDTLSNSMDELVKTAGDLAQALEPGEHRVWVYYWSDSIAYRFEASCPRFVQCAGGELMDALALSFNAAPLMALDARGCRWPVGRADEQHLFCNAPVEPFTPGLLGGCYCATHRLRAKGGPRERAALKAAGFFGGRV